jgi:hypothetical protein
MKQYLVNPNWINPALAKKDQYEAALNAFLATVPTDQREISFDEIRAHFGKTPEQFSDAEIEFILKEMGQEVI